MNSDQVGGIVRAVLAAIGGYFVGEGIIDQATATSLIGVGVTLASAIWSMWTNKTGTVIAPK